MSEVFQMSEKELDRVCVIKKVIAKEITQYTAANLLGLQSDRQIRNLVQSYKQFGPQSLISRQRGQKSNRMYPPEFKQDVLQLVRTTYHDFTPQLVSEQLLKTHDIRLSRETLRKWMTDAHLHIPRSVRKKIHPLRSRRALFGELIQIDASIHDWFEGRHQKCALIVFVDDATSKITAAYFCPNECLEGYFVALKSHILRYGRPLALYSDRHAIFGGNEKIQNAQFIRALKDLDVRSILAGSPQAKGRVERANRTLQDRLIKEMRLNGISDIEAANQYLPSFIEEYNKKFSKEPMGSVDAHRPLASGCDLEQHLTRCEERTLSKNLSFSFYNTYYQILEPQMSNRLAKKRVKIYIRTDGSLRVFYGSKELKFSLLSEYREEKVTLNIKEKLTWEPKPKKKVSKNHPWRRWNPNFYGNSNKEYDIMDCVM